MSKRNIVAVSAFTMVMGLSSITMASDGSAVSTGLWIFFGIALACGFAIGVAALGTGIGMGNAINGALQGVARNPEGYLQCLYWVLHLLSPFVSMHWLFVCS